MISSLIKKEIKKQIFDSLFSIDEIFSVTLVGSFVDKADLSGISDIDTVVICRNLNRNLYLDCIEKIETINLDDCGLGDFTLKINTTFGPLKFDANNIVVIHLMIYDISSHINHVTSSPFTCYDWERSDVRIGSSIKEIYQVGTLQYRDFLGTRRSLDNYLNDLNNNQISFREYSFKDNKAKQLKKFKSLDDRHLGEYAYHIIKNLIVNYRKFCTSENISLNDQDIIEEAKRFFPKNKNDHNKLKEIAAIKLKRGKNFPRKSLILTKKFIKNFEITIKNEWSDSVSIYFLRHFETELNDGSFLGQGRDPDIKNKFEKINFKNINRFYCSPTLRSVNTAKNISNEIEIITDSNLKEINYGLAEGLHYEELFKKYPEIIKKWNKYEDPRFPEGENVDDVFNRLKLFLIKLSKEVKIKKDKRVCVVTHNVVLRCMLGYYFNIEKKYWHKLDIPHGYPLEFKLKNNSYYPNIDRSKLYKIQNKVFF